jgi:hypothetical protein
MGIAVDEGKLTRALALERGSGFVSDGRHPGILLGYERESRLKLLCPIAAICEHFDGKRTGQNRVIPGRARIDNIVNASLW